MHLAAYNLILREVRYDMIALRYSFLFVLLVMSSAWQVKSQEKNILLICIDDLRPELGSFGASYISSPHIDSLARNGRQFSNHFVNAPSCGPSRYTLLTGMYGPGRNNALFQRAERIRESRDKVKPSMPEWFRNHGYTTVSVGKVSHHPGGLGGEDWNDPDIIEMPNAWDRSFMPVAEWQHPRGAMHGLAHGEIREGQGTMDVFQSVEGADSIYPDGHIVNEALRQLEELTSAKKKPFFLAVGIIRPHLPFGAPKKYMEAYKNVNLPPIAHPTKPEGTTTWHAWGEFMQYNRWGKDPRTDKVFADEVRRHYAACVSYADEQVGRLLRRLKETGADKNTIIVLWGDHGWNLGEHNIWGKHNLFEEALRSPLIISYPSLVKPGKRANGVVETIDIFPTLCDLANISVPNYTKGVSLLPMLEKPETPGHSAIAYWGDAKALRNQRYRLIAHENGAVELYDHTSPEKENSNIADKNSSVVQRMRQEMDLKLATEDKK